MPADASIYQNFLRPPKTIQEYDAEAQQQEQNALALQQGRMQMAALRQQQADDQGLRNYLAGGADLSTPQGQAGLYQVAPKAAGGILKTQAEIAKENAQTGLYGAQTQEVNQKTAVSQFDLHRKQIEHGVMALVASPTAQAASQAINEGVTSGKWTMQEAQALQQSLQSEPDYQKWRNAQMMQLLNANDALNQMRHDQELQLKSNNELVGLDGSVNQSLLGAKKQIAKSGASNTNISLNTDKTLTSTIAKGLGDQLDASLSGANAAQNTINTANQIRDLVRSGKIISGPGADYRVTLTRIGDMLGVGGADAQEKLSNTAQLVQSLAKTELDAAASMKGQGQITEGERAMLRRASSGDLNMTPSELNTLAGAMDKTARARISGHQSRVEKLKSVPGADSLIPFYSVDMPAAYTGGPAQGGQQAGQQMPDLQSLAAQELARRQGRK